MKYMMIAIMLYSCALFTYAQPTTQPAKASTTQPTTDTRTPEEVIKALIAKFNSPWVEAVPIGREFHELPESALPLLRKALEGDAKYFHTISAIGGAIQTITDKHLWELRTKEEYDKTVKTKVDKLLAIYKASNGQNKWDINAKKAITNYVHHKEGGYLLSLHQHYINETKKYASRAMKAGCKDALVLLCFADTARYEEKRTVERDAVDMIKATQAMIKSKYPIEIRTYALLQGVQYAGSGIKMKREKNVKIGDTFLKELDKIIEEAEKDETIKIFGLAETMKDTMLYFKRRDNDRGKHIDKYYEFLKKVGDKGEADLFAGITYIKYAWDARGTDYAHKVGVNKFQLFKQRIRLAREHLTKSWETEPLSTAAQHMIVVEKADFKDLNTAFLWFNRAMYADPYDAQACSAIASLLHPKWHGETHADPIYFAQRCIMTGNHESLVPLTILPAYQEAFMHAHNYSININQYIEYAKHQDHLYRRVRVALMNHLKHSKEYPTSVVMDGIYLSYGARYWKDTKFYFDKLKKDKRKFSSNGLFTPHFAKTIRKHIYSLSDEKLASIQKQFKDKQDKKMEHGIKVMEKAIEANSRE